MYQYDPRKSRQENMAAYYADMAKNPHEYPTSAEDNTGLAAAMVPFGAEEKGLDDRMAQAQLLRQRGQQAPGMRQAGNVTRAAHPLEFLAGLGQQAMGQGQVQATNAARGDWAQRASATMLRQLEERRRRALQGGSGPDMTVGQGYDLPNADY